MSDKALEVLHNTFGFTAFRGQQAPVIRRVLAGGDALVLMPTGGGKSLCYQVPALIRSGTAVVVSPLIALMEDQVRSLNQLGVRVGCLNSAMPVQDQMQTEEDLVRGELDLLYVAPERLLMPRMLAILEQITVALFAIDEAHCVSQWGHDFRPEYLQLAVLGQRFPGVPRVALTATADSRTQKEIIERLALNQAESFVGSFDRPNIFYRISQKRQAKQQLHAFILKDHPGESGIVYCISRKKVEELSEWLNSHGIRALPYHAGMSPETRSRNQHLFHNEEGLIMVATVAFGMGVDKPDVRFVAHMDLPRSIEAYYQETGRAGRDGLPATAWLAYGLQDVIILGQMLSQSSADVSIRNVEKQKLESMLAFCEISGCRRQALLAYFDEALDEPCGHCDLCAEPVVTWDATDAARKALSNVYRTGQRYGVTHLVDVLMGRENTRVKQLGHGQLSTFGIGRDLSQKQWRSVYRQLVARGFLSVIEEHGGLQLSETSRPLLRGDEVLMLRRDRYEVQEARETRDSIGKVVEIHPEDEPLWNALREARRELAKTQGIPPYMIFHDSTLREMIRRRPASLGEMEQVSGVGQRKLLAYGDEFLTVLRTFESSSVGAGKAEDVLA